jgi:LysM repeat protein
LTSKRSDTSSAKPFVPEKFKKSVSIALASSGVSLALLTPFFVSASFFSIPALLQSFSKESSAAGSAQNSQTMSVLAPARNIDPKPSMGGGDITLVGGTALMAEEGPSGTAADVEQHTESTAISVYTVHKGDSLAGIAKMFGVTVNTIVWANDLKGAIKEGQELVILPIAGVRHTVAKGDTIASLAKKYKADAGEIAQYNDLETGASLAVGDVVIIPDGEIAAPVPAKKTKPSTGSKNPYRGGGGPSLSGYYGWPVDGGVVTQGIHGYNGIDIGARTGTGVFASAGGVVIIANGSGGWNGGYGNYVVIRHDNGTQTLYGHLSKVLTSSGARVGQGETIGLVGSTGKSTGSHLHFEVRGATNPFGH